MSTPSSIPKSAHVVIVGGGIAGSSVAYHLAKLGWRDVVLLEQNALAGGTTWHAAGLVGQLRTSNSMTKVNKYSVALYAQLEAETGVATGWNNCGSLIVGTCEARMTQLRRTAAMAEVFGVEAHLISASEAGERWPLIRTDDVLGAVWLPGDGRVRPKETALALAEGARQNHVMICEGIRVTDLLHRDGRVRGVATAQGEIAADYVVLTGGMWSREIAARAGVSIPLYPVEHHYIVSEPIEGAHDGLPVGRDPDRCTYFRPEEGGIMLGAFQKFTKPWMVDEIPADFSFDLLEPDWPKYQEPLAAGKHRIPALETAAFPRFVNGPESFTPDNNFLLGETAELHKLYIAAGFNSAGIASAGGAGKYLAEWMTGGEAPMDLWSVDVRRFSAAQNSRAFLRDRVTEVLGLHYQLAWPNREFETGRDRRHSPLHDRLATAGACFGAKMGLERPNWFARGGMAADTEYSFERQNWFDCVAAEHRAAREAVAVFDQSSFSKFMLEGPEACAVLQWLCGNDVDVPPGRAVYTGLFNHGGTYETDLTVVRLAEDRYYIVSASAQTVRDFDWITRNTPKDARVSLIDITSDWGVVGVMGPKSRGLLSAITDADLSNATFPFGAAKETAIGGATALAVRMTYVGELGWELHAKNEDLPAIYDAIMQAGAEHGAVNAGHYAINGLRLEKAYRAWGHELSTDDDPIQAGLGFAVAWDKPVRFVGQEVLRARRGETPTKRLLAFVLEDPEPLLWGGEPILRDGKTVGYTTSGGYGYTLGASVGLGYIKHAEGVDKAYIESGSFAILVDGVPIAATAHTRPPYDPGRERILA